MIIWIGGKIIRSSLLRVGNNVAVKFSSRTWPEVLPLPSLCLRTAISPFHSLPLCFSFFFFVMLLFSASFVFSLLCLYSSLLVLSQNSSILRFCAFLQNDMSKSLFHTRGIHADIPLDCLICKLINYSNDKVILSEGRYSTHCLDFSSNK